MPRDSPPADYYKMMRQLYHVGNALNQIAQKAHVLNVMDVQRYDKAVAEFEQAVRNITAAVILPEETLRWSSIFVTLILKRFHCTMSIFSQME